MPHAIAQALIRARLLPPEDADNFLAIHDAVQAEGALDKLDPQTQQGIRNFLARFRRESDGTAQAFAELFRRTTMGLHHADRRLTPKDNVRLLHIAERLTPHGYQSENFADDGQHIFLRNHINQQFVLSENLLYESPTLTVKQQMGAKSHKERLSLDHMLFLVNQIFELENHYKQIEFEFENPNSSYTDRLIWVRGDEGEGAVLSEIDPGQERMNLERKPLVELLRRSNFEVAYSASGLIHAAHRDVSSFDGNVVLEEDGGLVFEIINPPYIRHEDLETVSQALLLITEGSIPYPTDARSEKPRVIRIPHIYDGFVWADALQNPGLYRYKEIPIPAEIFRSGRSAWDEAVYNLTDGLPDRRMSSHLRDRRADHMIIRNVQRAHVRNLARHAFRTG